MKRKIGKIIGAILIGILAAAIVVGAVFVSLKIGKKQEHDIVILYN